MKNRTFLTLSFMGLISAANCFGAENTQESQHVSVASDCKTADVANDSLDQKKIALGVFLALLQNAQRDGTRESMQLVVNYANGWRQILNQSLDPRDQQLHDELGVIIDVYEKALQEADETASGIVELQNNQENQ